jgi:2-polyprenyl-3-methyl-5-hydroxy-6-metoxy-1,4-benzoquinol methylase
MERSNMKNDKIELKDVRQALLRTDEYKHRVAWYKRRKLEEIRDIGLEIVAGVSLENPGELNEEVFSEDFWRRKTRDLWYRESPDSPTEIFEWYGSHKAYLVENMIRQAEVVDVIRQCHRWLREYDVDSILDYGGGVGDFSLYHAVQGYDVVYADVEGSFPWFVGERLNQRPEVDVSVAEITGPRETPSDVVTNVDAAICLEVIEHLPHVQTVIDGFSEVINSDGLLITSWTFEDWRDDPDDVYTPCHINTGRDNSREVREYMELYFEEVEHTWNAQERLWRRK